MNMANRVVKWKVGKQNVQFSTSKVRYGTVLHRIDTFYTVLLDNVFVKLQEF